MSFIWMFLFYKSYAGSGKSSSPCDLAGKIYVGAKAGLSEPACYGAWLSGISVFTFLLGLCHFCRFSCQSTHAVTGI